MIPSGFTVEEHGDAERYSPPGIIKGMQSRGRTTIGCGKESEIQKA